MSVAGRHTLTVLADLPVRARGVLVLRFCSVRETSRFQVAHTARGFDLLDMHGRLRCDFDRETEFCQDLLQLRSLVIRRTLAGLNLFKIL
jgi:hypothetical protein